ncbi:MAG: M50 family metallopeptidase [Micrococcaceae bacterium]
MQFDPHSLFAVSESVTLNSAVTYWLILVAILLSIPQLTWNIFGRFVTVFHEMGHALTGFMVGRRVKKIMIQSDMSGETHSKGNRGFPLIFSSWWGYPFPILLGVGLIYASYHDWAIRAISVITILLVLMLLFIRNIHGASMIFALLALCVASVFITSSLYKAYICLALGIALIIGSWRALINVTRVHYGYDKNSSDAYFLADLTGLPSWFWFVTYYLVFITLTLIAINIISGGLVINLIQRILATM